MCVCKVIFSEACVKNSVHRGVSRPRPKFEVGGSMAVGGVSRPRLRGEVGGSVPRGGVYMAQDTGGKLGGLAGVTWDLPPGPHQ